MDGRKKGAHKGGGGSFSECVESRCGLVQGFVGRTVGDDGSRDDGFSLDGGGDDGLSGFGGHAERAEGEGEGRTEGEGSQRRRDRAQQRRIQSQKVYETTASPLLMVWAVELDA